MSDVSNLFDPEADSLRLSEVVAAAAALEATVRPDDDADRVVLSPEFASLSLNDFKSVCTNGAEIARVDTEGFLARYGRVLGAAEALERTRVHISKEFDNGGLADSPRRRAASRLLRDAAARLAFALESFEQFTASAGAEDALRKRAAAFTSELDELRARVHEAASEFGLDGEKLEWGRYADSETVVANRWRWITMTLFATGFILAMMSVLHLLGDNPRWPDVALKVLAVVSIGAIGTYAGTQATEHRREARLARRNALDLVTLSLFVARLAPDSRDLILRNFGMQRFASAPDNAAPQDPALGISSQLVALAGKVADIAKARP